MKLCYLRDSLTRRVVKVTFCVAVGLRFAFKQRRGFKTNAILHAALRRLQRAAVIGPKILVEVDRSRCESDVESK